MAKIDGIRSYASLRSRAQLLVASLPDIIRSKATADRPQDRAVLPLLRKTLREKR